MFNIYEIYVRDIITGERGWDIHFVVALDRDDVTTYPFFDEVIMRDGSFGDDVEAVKSSGLGMSEAVWELVYGVAA